MRVTRVHCWVLLALFCFAACTSSESPTSGEGDAIPRPDASQLSESQQTFYDEALEQLAALDAAPPLERAEAFGQLGMRFLADGFAESAEACFVEAERMDPERFEWNYFLAHVYRGYGQSDEAEKRFQRAVELSPDYVAAWVWLGDTLFQAAKYAPSRTAFEKAIELHGEAASAHLGLGRVALAEKRFEEAVAAFTRTLELAPGSSVAHYPLAQAYRGLGDLERAQEHLDLRGDTEAFPYDPVMEEIRSGFGSPGVLTDRGGNAFSKADFARAVESFREVLEAVPDNAMAHANLGAALFHQGDRGAARAAYERALELDPQDAAIWYSLGVIRFHDGDRVAAIRYYEQALERDAGYPAAHLELGHLMRASGELDRAVEHYRGVLELEPRHAEAQLGHAMALVKLERWPAARDALVAASDALPDQPAFSHALARVCAAAPDASVRDGRRALALIDPLIRAGQQSTDIGETIAMAMAELGEFEQAVRYQEQVVSVVRASGNNGLLPLMGERLAAYRASRAWREPWPSDDPLHVPPTDALPAPPRRGGIDS